MKLLFLLIGTVLLAGTLPLTGFSAAPATRALDEDVNSAEVRQRQRLTPGPTLLFNGLGLSPAGEQVRIGDMGMKMVIAPDRKAVVAVCSGYNEVGVNVISLDREHKVQFIRLANAFNGLAFHPDGKRFYVSGGPLGVIYAFKYSDGKAELEKEIKPQVDAPATFLAGMAVQKSRGRLYVCNEANGEIWVLKLDTLALERVIPVGEFPHSCALGADDEHLYVSNWGSRSVSVIATSKLRHLRDITVGIRPNDMALAPDGRLFIACAGDNTVHVIATAALEAVGPDASPARRLWEGTREVISTSLYPQSPEGSTPCAVAVAPDGKTLFVANADQNSVMAVDISGALMEDAAKRQEKISLVNGFIPVGWYPTAAAVTPDNQTLLVANGKGLASRPSYPPRTKSATKGYRGIGFDHTGRTFEGNLSFISRPTPAQMAAYTEQVRRNSNYRPAHMTQAPLPSESVIPTRAGEPCPIKYVIYIIKENRTYDQVMGDMTDATGKPIGNGDPKLAIYGEKVTPNQHALAREYVLLDYLFSNSEVSVDGHSWCDAAIATDFNQRSWIHSYSGHGKLPGNAEMETPANGYLWDLCRRHGVSFKTYGEGSQRVPSINRGKWVGPRDTGKVKGWIADLQEAEKTGELPRFTIMSLGENHTQGTRAGAPTPEACVGNNDLALGQLVEAASKSRFWNEMAIFVIEDDTQNGPDHVDAHRTVGLVISPYCKRRFVDSTLYTTASMIRTIELILGLPPMTQFDAGATPMFNCFQKKIEATEWAALTPKVDLNARNTAKSPFAKESGRMNFKEFDRAPEDELNRILWHVARPGEPYPTPIHGALFTSLPE